MDKADDQALTSPGAERSITSIAERVLGELDPEHKAAQAAHLEVVALGFFGPPSARRRIARTVLDRPRRSVPGGFSTEQLELVAQILLLVLNGVGTELLADVAKHRLAGIGGWWHRRRAKRVLTAVVAPDGGSTPVPRLPPIDARIIGDLVTELASRTGIDPQRAQLIGTLVTAEISARPDGG
jgi:hypothetical protein